MADMRTNEMRLYSGTATGADGVRYSVRMMLTAEECAALAQAGVLDRFEDFGEIVWMQHATDEWCAMLSRDAAGATLQ